MGLYISCMHEDYALPDSLTQMLTENLEKLLKENRMAGGELGLILVDDQYIKSLNEQYRNKNAPTDVLSFSFLEPGSEESKASAEFAVGDIFISIDRAREQAIDAGHSLEKEIVLLAVHGLLHLFGYDHEDEEDQKAMQKKESIILERFDL